MDPRIGRRVSAVALAFFALAGVLPGQAVMSVNDTMSHGTLANSALSLDEAIRLANGDIDLTVLSRKEKAQISGVPGAGVADVITFSFTVFPGTISMTADLTPLRTGLDTIDVDVSGMSLGDIILDGMLLYHGVTISGSNTTVAALEVTGTVGGGVRIQAANGVDCLGCIVRGCRFTSTEHGVEVLGSDGGGLRTGDSVNPIVLEDNEYSLITSLGIGSAGVRVSGGSGDLNEVHVQLLRGMTNRTGTALDVAGGDFDAILGTGDSNTVVVTAEKTIFDRSGLPGGVGLRIAGASDAATSATGNDVSVVLDEAVLTNFNGGGGSVRPGGGDNHFVELVSRDSRVESCSSHGLSFTSAGSGTGCTLHGNFMGDTIDSINGAGLLVRTPASGSAISAAIDVELLQLSLVGNSGAGLEVSAIDSGAHQLTVDAIECLITDNGLGVEVDPGGAASTTNVLLERNAFRRNGTGLQVTAAVGTSVVDAGGGALGSRGENTFESQTGCGIENQNSVALQAIRNDWGAADGPSDCDPGNSDGIPDPTGSGDGVGEHVVWSPFVAYDQSPRLTITGSLNPPSDITILVDEGETGSLFLLFFSLGRFDPAPDTNLGAHFFLVPPLPFALPGITGTPMGPFSPPGSVPDGVQVFFQAGVLGTNAELTNFALLE